MNTFTYSSPATVKEAVTLLSGRLGVSRVFAGGTDLLVQLRGKAIDPVPERLVDIKGIPELKQLSYDESTGLTIGAAVTCADLCRNSTVADLYPGLVDSASIIGGSAIQERATIGGNICNAAPSADAIPSLIVLGSSCTIVRETGSKNLRVEDFCVEPGRSILLEGELLATIVIPAPQPRSASSYIRFTPRHEMDIAVAGAATMVCIDASGMVIDASIALSAVAPTPLVAVDAAEHLIGRKPDDSALQKAASIAAEMCSPISDVRGTAEFRRHLISVLTKRALQTSLDRITGRAN